MIRRVLALAALLTTAACSSAPLQTFPPLNYSYLPPITLNVAAVNVVNSYALDPAAQQLVSEDPAPPPAILAAELTRRLIPGGAPGVATITIENASIDQVNGSLVGALAVRIDVATADGTRTGYTEASVQRSDAAPDGDASQNQVQAALYAMTKELMDAMNVQLQYQIQANLPSWVVPGIGGAPVGLAPATVSGSTIQAAPLAPPMAVPATPGGGPTTLPGAPGAAAPATPAAPPLVLPPAAASPATGLSPPQQLVPY